MPSPIACVLQEHAIFVGCMWSGNSKWVLQWCNGPDATDWLASVSTTTISNIAANRWHALWRHRSEAAPCRKRVTELYALDQHTCKHSVVEVFSCLRVFTNRSSEAGTRSQNMSDVETPEYWCVSMLLTIEIQYLYTIKLTWRLWVLFCVDCWTEVGLAKCALIYFSPSWHCKVTDIKIFVLYASLVCDYLKTVMSPFWAPFLPCAWNFRLDDRRS